MAGKLRPGIRVDEFIAVDDPDDEGTYETWWGRAWVHVKVSDPTKPFMIANELVASRLAAALGLPTLPGETARDAQERNCWVSPRIMSPTGGSPPPAIAQKVVADHPVVVAGMVAFDAWIHNIDRTEDNVLYDPRLGLWLIDHENSLAEPDGRAFNTKAVDAALTRLSSHGFANKGIDKEALTFWTRRIAMVGDPIIERPLIEANQRGLITKVQLGWLSTYLVARRDNIASLVPVITSGVENGTFVAPPAQNENGQIDLFSPDAEA